MEFPPRGWKEFAIPRSRASCPREFRERMIGSSETLARRIRRLHNFYALIICCLRSPRGGLDPNQVASSLERLARKVRPVFRTNDSVHDATTVATAER